MKIIDEGVAGRAGKGDIQVTVKPAEKRSIDLRSSIERLFGDNIRREIDAELDRLGVNGVALTAIDDGVLDYVIAARVEAAIAAATSEPTPYRPSERAFEFDPGRLHRSRLYVPGNNPSLSVNAWLFGADMILFDLEDSVPPSEKQASRYLVRNTLLVRRLGESEAAVRINSLSGDYGIDDLEVVVPSGPEVIALPKAESAADIELLKSEIVRIQAAAGTNHKIGIMPIIESAIGVVKAPEIAAVDGVVMLTFGAEDFTKDIGTARTREGKEHFVARCNIVCAAKAYGRFVSDTVYSDFGDIDGLIASTEESKSIGFDGRGLIHPLQVEPVHEVFAPNNDELLYAVRVVRAAEEAEKAGVGAISIGSKMIDPPIVARARGLIAIAVRSGIPLPKPDGE